ncbi:MAG: A24 family peptidase [Gammaproteobacteria bacterium]|nr:A24 family peptidase [Gammaproteobacteria bacterium]|tara:strand:- start:109 stop:762 length:654 start_codon:yes stop_codon:yes gene_type:complete
MDIIITISILVLGVLYGRLLKSTVNWLNVDGFQIDQGDFKMELFCVGAWLWASLSLQPMEGTIFALIAGILFTISWIDFNTYQIPLLLIIVSAIAAIFGVLFELTSIKSAIYGVVVGSIIPLALIGLTYLITKRQGMGYGDIQLGFVLGVWLGPVRMALTLFVASLLSLVVWLILSGINGFERDRALPFAPYLAIAGLGTFVGSVYFPSLFHYLIIY